MTTIIAHRGVRTHQDYNMIAPENTLPAFKQAETLKVGIELDVQATLDGELVVYHDDETGKVFTQPDGDKLVVSSRLKELKEAHLNKLSHNAEVRRLLDGDITYQLAEAFETVKIPLLSEVLETLPKTHFYLELKTSDTDVQTGLNNQLEERLVQMIQDKKLHDRVTVISFSNASLKKIKRLDPSINTGWDVPPSKWNTKIARFLPWYGKHRLKVSSIHPSYANTTDQFIKSAHKQGLKIMPWVHHETRSEEAKLVPELINKGVDGVITNTPDLFVLNKETV